MKAQIEMAALGPLRQLGRRHSFRCFYKQLKRYFGVMVKFIHPGQEQSKLQYLFSLRDSLLSCVCGFNSPVFLGWVARCLVSPILHCSSQSSARFSLQQERVVGR